MNLTRLQRSISIPTLILLAFLSPLGTSRSIAQAVPSGGRSSGQIEGRFKFVPVPYAGYNRSLGFQVGFLPLVMFNPVATDTLSPSSIAGGLGLYTTNKSWFGMAFARLFLDRDSWRISLAGGAGSTNFQFYVDSPINDFIPYNAGSALAFAEVQRKLMKSLYIGVNYAYIETTTSTELLPITDEAILRGIGLKATFDRRQNLYYPRSELQVNVAYTSFPGAFGNDYVSNKIKVDYTHYFPFRDEQDVLVGRLFVGLGIGDLQFNQQFIVGQGPDIRGYTQGKYRGEYMLAFQGEYRWNFAARWGIVGFGGIATVFESLNPGDDGKLLPGIGTGFRYTIIPDNHMNVGLDIAVGRDDWGLYFRLGEAF